MPQPRSAFSIAAVPVAFVALAWLLYWLLGMAVEPNPPAGVFVEESGSVEGVAADLDSRPDGADLAAELGDGPARADVGGPTVQTGVRGRILDAKTGAPLPGVEVMAMRRPPGFEKVFSRFRSAFFQGKGFWSEQSQPPEVLASVETGPDGSFELLGLPPGNVFLDGRADFTFVRKPAQVRVARGEVRDGVELIGTASGRIRGTVYAPDGLPASGAVVHLRPGLNAFLGQITQRQYRWLEAATDAEGKFDLVGVPAGHGYTLSAAGPNIALAEEHGIDVEIGRVTNLDIQGMNGAAIRGRVLDVDGTPCAGANVAMVYLDVSRVLLSADGRTEPVTTDADGVFSLQHVAAGRIAFVAAADGKGMSGIEELAVVDRGFYEDFELLLGEGESIEGIVVDDADRVVAGAKIEVRPMEPPNSPDVMKTLLNIRNIEVESGLDGRFVAPGITARRLFVQASKPGYVSEVRLGHDREKEDDLRIVLSRGVVVRGRVTRADGTPIERFRVDTRSRKPRAEGDESADDGGERRGPPWARGRRRGGRTMQLAEGQEMTDRAFGGSWRDFNATDGTFEITGVPPGRIRVRVRAEGYRDPDNQNVEIEAGGTSEEIVFALEAGALARGRVIDAVSGEPVSEAQVTAYRDRSDDEGGGRGRNRFFSFNFDPQDMDFLGMVTRNSASTDASGRFEIAGLADGDYRFTARHPEHAKSSVKAVAIGGDGAAEDIVIEIESGGAIEGMVTGRDRLPMADALIVAFSMSAGSFKSSSTDRQGRYRIDGLPAGQYAVFKSRIGERAMNIGYDLLGNMRLKTVRVRKGETTKFDVNDESENSVRVWGIVRDGDEPVKRGMVTAMSSDGQGFLGIGIRAQPTDENGRYELIGLEPGDYFFQVSRFRGRPQQANLSVEIPEGAREVRIDLELPQSRITGRVVDTAGNPVSGIVVRAGVEEGGLESAPGLLGLILKNGVAQDRTDDDGAFELDKVAAGVYRLSVGARDGRREHRQYGEAVLEGVAVDGNFPVENLQLTLPFAGKITGTVFDGSGQPVAGAEVHYSREDAPSFSDPSETIVDLLGVQARPERTDADGRFELEGLTPGTYVVRADADGLAPGVSDAVTLIEEGNVDVRLSVVRGANVRVRATNIVGEKIPFASIRVLDGDGKPLTSKVSVMSVFKRLVGRDEQKEDTGWYEIGSVPPGVYTVVITEKGQPEVRVTREIRDGEEIEWEIDVTAELEAQGRARK